MKSNLVKINGLFLLTTSLSLFACGGGGGGSAAPAPGAALGALGLASSDLGNISTKLDIQSFGVSSIADQLINGPGASFLTIGDPCIDLISEDKNGDGTDDFATVSFHHCTDEDQDSLIDGPVEFTHLTDPAEILNLLGGGCQNVLDISQLEAPDEGLKIEFNLDVTSVGEISASHLSGELKFADFPTSELAAVKGELLLEGLELENGKVVNAQVEFCLKIDLAGSNVTPTGKIEVKIFDSSTSLLLSEIEYLLQADGTMIFDVFDDHGTDLGVGGTVDDHGKVDFD